MCFLLLLEDEEAEEAEEEQHEEEYDVKEVKKKEKVAKSKRFVIILESMFMQVCPLSINIQIYSKAQKWMVYRLFMRNGPRRQCLLILALVVLSVLVFRTITSVKAKGQNFKPFTISTVGNKCSHMALNSPWKNIMSLNSPWNWKNFWMSLKSPWFFHSSPWIFVTAPWIK